ncbi:MAG: aspartate kinase [Flavobacteriales bacterium]|nr:MAG: aspartate kinase [Flavobacteriales bacterium]
MKVFKFGGASVKDAESVENVAVVLKKQGLTPYLLVVSAMGKTTNNLEEVLRLYMNDEQYLEQIEVIKTFHSDIANTLFENNHSIFETINGIFEDLMIFLSRNKSKNYNFIYDQVVVTGEIISSKILSAYLNSQQIHNTWLDARHYIKTDNNYREGKVNWELTEQNISTIAKTESYVTQGFVASDDNNFNTTLGREGSDYSAGIFAYCLNAESMTIWKDVAGVMTGDPRKFEKVELIEYLSYKEAIEMAYYGASVIHPKTLQPLQRKNIPFFVKSFLAPLEKGTEIGIEKPEIKPKESYILKEHQVLLNISTKDFSFITENHLSMIFSLLVDYKIKVSLMQNSAISLALCLEDKYHNVHDFSAELHDGFEIQKTENVSLLSVRNIELKNIEKTFVEQEILLKQMNQQTLQMVIKTN